MKKTNEILNVILYCRVSSDEQAEGCSLDEQERQLRVAVTASAASIAALSRIGAGETVLAIAATEEFLELMHRSLREFAPEAE